MTSGKLIATREELRAQQYEKIAAHQEENAWPIKRKRDYSARDKQRALDGYYRERDRKRSVGHRLALNGGIPYFIGWDGEGMQVSGRHTYTLIANSEGAYHENAQGLHTTDIFDFLLAQSHSISHDQRVLTHVMYGLGYDVNMWLQDLERDFLKILYATNHVIWNGYRISWVPRHTFTVKKDTRKITLWEVMGYWQRPFIAACRMHNILSVEEERAMHALKQRRGTFDDEHREEIRAYCLSECRALAQLTTTLARDIHTLGLQTHRWDGAGALASALLKKHDVAKYNGRNNSPPEANHAYFGGRIELLRYGNTVQPIYEYDLTSAYPYATTFLPCLAHGVWRSVCPSELIERLTLNTVALLHVQFSAPGYEARDPLPFGGVLRAIPNESRRRENHWCPVPHRDNNGYVRFPVRTTTWIFAPEYLLAREWVRQLGGTLDVLDALEYKQECEHAPGAWVPDVFTERNERKKRGDPTEYALKLALNACYGKFAQRKGHATKRRPPFHNLVWAGLITSHTRAAIGRLALLNPNRVLAFATDAVYTLDPLPIEDTGHILGGWKCQVHPRGGVFVQPGVYWLRGENDGEWSVRHTRGFSVGDLPPERVVIFWQHGVRTAQYQRTRFTSLGMVVHADNDDSWNRWAQWDTYQRDLRLNPLELKRDACVMLQHSAARPHRKLVQTRPYRLPPDAEVSYESSINDEVYDGERVEGDTLAEAQT